MTLLQDPRRRPVSELEFFGITLSATEDGHHVGLAYRTEKGVRWAHMAWHERSYADNDPEPCAWWGESTFDAQTRRFLSSWCREKIPSGRTPLPYSFAPPSLPFFDPVTGTVPEPKPGEGLTCATYVEAICALLGVALVDRSKWPARAADIEWQTKIVGMLKDDYPDHAKVLERHIGAPRVRPSEVTAAFLAPPEQYPIAYGPAWEVGRRLEILLAAG